MALEAIQVRNHGTEGRTVWVLHGGPGAPGSAWGLSRLLSQYFQVREPLQRRSGPVPLTMDQHVRDLAEVADEKCALVGHSFGAMLALSYASRYPQRVSRVMLIGCGSYDDACRVRMQETLKLRLGDEGQAKLATLRADLESATEPKIRDALMRKLGGVFSILESYDALEDPEEERFTFAPDAQGHHETWTDLLRLQAQGIEPQAFRAIQSPVILIHGDTDPHPFALTRDILKAVIPHLESIELERCGHEPWRERYAREHFLELLRVWLMRDG